MARPAGSWRGTRDRRRPWARLPPTLHNPRGRQRRRRPARSTTRLPAPPSDRPHETLRRPRPARPGRRGRNPDRDVRPCRRDGSDRLPALAELTLLRQGAGRVDGQLRSSQVAQRRLRSVGPDPTDTRRFSRRWPRTSGATISMDIEAHGCRDTDGIAASRGAARASSRSSRCSPGTASPGTVPTVPPTRSGPPPRQPDSTSMFVYPPGCRCLRRGRSVGEEQVARAWQCEISRSRSESSESRRATRRRSPPHPSHGRVERGSGLPGPRDFPVAASAGCASLLLKAIRRLPLVHPTRSQ